MSESRGIASDRARLGAVLPGWVGVCVRLRFWLIAAGSLAYTPVGYGGTGGDFAFFRTGARVLLGLHTDFGAGSHGRFGIYAADPTNQVGPVSILVTAPVAALSRDTGRLVVSVLMALALPLLLWLVESAARSLATRGEADLQAVVLGAGLFLLPMWHELVLWAHVDDVLVLVCAAWTIRALARGQAAFVGLSLALAIDSKPWAIGLLPLLLALPTRAERTRAAAVAAAGVALAWAPFLLAPGALSGLAGYHIPVLLASPLHVLGVQAGAPMPAWARPAQLALAWVLAWIAVRRGRPAAALLVVVAARVALDAGAYSYYFTGLVIGCAIYEIAGTARRFAWLTAAVAFVEYDIKWINDSPTVAAWMNLAALPICALVLLAPQHRAQADDEAALQAAAA